MADGLVSEDKAVSLSKRRCDFTVIFLLFTSVWILRIVDLPAHPIPIPAVHDEFANYLGAKTFALGRLTNPPHEFLSDSFLEIHVLSEPTRMMKYQPMMAGFMALGIVAFGNAYWGVVLLVSIAVAASYWMMRGWVNRNVALCVSIFILLLFRAPHYWIDSYWGGAHVMLGSFLLLGAYPRIIYHKQYGYLWVAMLGVVAVMLSRPYEGLLLILSLLACAGFTIWKKNSKEEIIIFLKSSIAPVVLISGALLAFQLHYNKTITNDYFTLPYMEYSKQRDFAPNFRFLSADKSRLSENYALRNIQKWEAEPLKRNFTLEITSGFKTSIGFIIGAWRVSKDSVAEVILGSLALFGFMLYPLLFYLNVRNRKYLQLHFLAIVQATGYCMVTWLFIPHYLSIYFSIYIIILSMNLRDVYLNAGNKKNFQLLAFMATVALVVFLLIPNKGVVGGFEESTKLKQSIIAKLSKVAERNLILVDGRLEVAEQTIHYSFVHNEPDIDNAKIVWAWYLSPEQNKKLIDYYRDRKVWYIEPYREKRLIPYAEHKEKP